MDFRVRVAGALIEDGSILLVRQRVTEARGWSLPGGKMEPGESLDQCLKREIREETGLEIRPHRLLYICDRMEPDWQTLHIAMEIQQVGGRLVTGTEPEVDADPISDVRLIPIEALPQYGFSEVFTNLAATGFPDAGRYAGNIQNIGL